MGSGAAYMDSGAVTANTWHTVFAWQDAVNNTINIQVDTGTVHTLAFSTSTADSTNPLSIGAYPNGSSETDGRLDEVALYRRVLTPEERIWLYNSGLGRNYAGVSNALAYGYTDPNHRHAVTAFAGNTYTYDANGERSENRSGSVQMVRSQRASSLPAQLSQKDLNRWDRYNPACTLVLAAHARAARILSCSRKRRSNHKS